MSNNFKEFQQYEAIPYKSDFQCPCGKSGDGYSWSLGPHWGEKLPRAQLVGWCSTPSGYMMVFECPICFTKFRYHGTTAERWDRNRFFSEMELVKKLER